MVFHEALAVAHGTAADEGMPVKWRLLIEPPAEGTWNMALDEALLEAHRAGLSPSTLRLYQWVRPTVSLGYAQRVAPEAVTAWREAGADVVRRPTGGRAVVHAGDLTYAIVTSGLPPGVAASYQLLSEALATGLRRLGLPARLAPGSAPNGRGPSCFAAATAADLGIDGHKVVGSAQVRRQRAVLQHGSMYLARSPWLDLLPAGDGLRTMEDLAGRPIGPEELGLALAAGVAEELGVDLEPGEATAWERSQAEQRQALWRV